MRRYVLTILSRQGTIIYEKCDAPKKFDDNALS